MKRALLMVLLMAGFFVASAQELYIFTDPASNLPAKVLNLRATAMYMPMAMREGMVVRAMPEVGVGISKNLQAKLYGYASNMMLSDFRVEGVGASFKYRFLSNDDIHKHFRMAVFAKASLVDNPVYMQFMEKHQLPDGNGGFEEHELPASMEAAELNIDGTHSGFTAGIVATELIRKTAISGGAAFIRKLNNLGNNSFDATASRQGMNYNLSLGTLVFPRSYDNYGQTNFNVYVELLGQSLFNGFGHYLDVAPGVQFIINSTSRVDLAYRFQAAGNMTRFSNKLALLRYEYNFLNLFSKKQK